MKIESTTVLWSRVAREMRDDWVSMEADRRNNNVAIEAVTRCATGETVVVTRQEVATLAQYSESLHAALGRDVRPDCQRESAASNS